MADWLHRFLFGRRRLRELRAAAREGFRAGYGCGYADGKMAEDWLLEGPDPDLILSDAGLIPAANLGMPPREELRRLRAEVERLRAELDAVGGWDGITVGAGPGKVIASGTVTWQEDDDAPV